MELAPPEAGLVSQIGFINGTALEEFHATQWISGFSIICTTGVDHSEISHLQCRLIKYDLILEIKPIKYPPGFTVISGFIQRKRIAGSDNNPVVTHSAGKRSPDRVVGMVPGDIVTSQGPYHFCITASARYGSSNLVQYPVSEGIAPKRNHLVHGMVEFREIELVFIFIDPVQYQ